MSDIIKKSIQFTKLLIIRTMKNNVSGTSAEMSYYLIMAFFPFVIFLITTFSYTTLFENNLLQMMERFLPEDAFVFLENIVNELLAARSGSLLSISMITTIFFASKGTNAIISGINRSYLVTEDRSFIKKNILSLVFTVLFALSVNILFIFIVLGQVITEAMLSLFELDMIYGQLWGYLRLGISLGFIFLVISFVYMYFPNLKPRLQFKEVYTGSLFATLFWIVSSLGFAFYVNNFSSYTLIYGSIAGIIVLLLWLYISSAILLVGAEINALLKTMKMR